MLSRALRAAVLAASTISVALLCGCPESRMAACKDTSECAEHDGGGHAVCYNFRCVDCQYDTDCPPGQVCSGVNACKSIDSRAHDEAQPGQPEAASWDECAARCKDKPCIAACDTKFKK
jgi:hypothetical protein